MNWLSLDGFPYGKMQTSFCVAGMLGALLVFSNSSRAQSASANLKPIAVQVVVVGQEVPPKYKVEAAKNLSLPGGGGDAPAAEDGSPPKGTPAPKKEPAKAAGADVAVQIPFEPDELPPGPLFVKNGKEWVRIQTTENSPSPKFLLQPTSMVTLAVGEEKGDSNAAAGSEMRYSTLGEFPVEENQDSMLILLIKDPSKPLKWNVTRKLALNTSWQHMPSGSITVFNASGLPIRSQIAKDVIPSLAAFQMKSVQPAANGDGVIPYMIDVQHPNGNWQHVINTAGTVPDGMRLILVPYGLVEPKTGRIASVVMIRDYQKRIKVPQSQAANVAPAVPAPGVPQ